MEGRRKKKIEPIKKDKSIQIGHVTFYYDFKLTRKIYSSLKGVVNEAEEDYYTAYFDADRLVIY